MAEGNAIELFFSYSHKDEALRDALAAHLSSLVQFEGVISSWHDRCIKPGTEWDGEIKTYLNTADIILLLISADFIASKYCREIEIQRAMERHETGEARVIPVILRPTDWTNTPFGKLQVLPKNGEPITSATWGSRDDAFLNVVQGIRTAASSLQVTRQQRIEQDQQAAVREAQRQKIRDFRQEVEQLATEEDGELSPLSRTILDTLRNSLGLEPDQVARIEQEVLQPYQVRKANRQEYEKVYRTALQQENPLKETTRNRLKRLQQALKLSDEEVTEIEGNAVSTIKRDCFDYPLSSSPISRSSFWFDVITVNNQGEVHKKERYHAKQRIKDLRNEVMLEMVVIPGGSFLMGSPTGEGKNNEHPQRSVAIKPFLMGKYPITQAQWQIVTTFPQVNRDLNAKPAYFKGANLPVEQVSWHDAIEFCARLSNHAGHQYRLPSEAEWEYACRAGTTTQYHYGTTIASTIANFNADYADSNPLETINIRTTTSVNKFQSPNKFGLYNMHGNIWEWCFDYWHDSYHEAPADGSPWLIGGDTKRRVVRGGSWIDSKLNCRSACRRGAIADSKDNIIGFRVVCTE